MSTFVLKFLYFQHLKYSPPHTLCLALSGLYTSFFMRSRQSDIILSKWKLPVSCFLTFCWTESWSFRDHFLLLFCKFQRFCINYIACNKTCSLFCKIELTALIADKYTEGEAASAKHICRLSSFSNTVLSESNITTPSHI